MGVRIGLVGLGSFGSVFAPLFANHPLVSEVLLCDTEPERITRIAEDPLVRRKLARQFAFPSLEEICKAPCDALIIITQPWLHAPQCVQAMEHGKHVYSAVPIISIPNDDEILDWCDRLVQTVRKTGLHYMLGETTFYHPQTMFCRRKAAEGAFGDFVYAEGEYLHDVDGFCNLRAVNASRAASKAGREWMTQQVRYRTKGVKTGPMHYPTHSVSGPVSVMKTRPLKVTAYGFANRTSDPFFQDYAFSNEMALFRMANGATIRILEMRESPGLCGHESETFRIFGTTGAFSENRWFQIQRPNFSQLTLQNLPKPRVETLEPRQMFDPLPPEVENAFKQVYHRDLPESALLSTDFQPRGHGGSHPYLVHEFIEAIASNRRPAIHVWEATRYMAMGVAAHQSALHDGETLPVPDWGDPPS